MDTSTIAFLRTDCVKCDLYIVHIKVTLTFTCIEPCSSSCCLSLPSQLLVHYRYRLFCKYHLTVFRTYISHPYLYSGVNDSYCLSIAISVVCEQKIGFHLPLTWCHVKHRARAQHMAICFWGCHSSSSCEKKNPTDREYQKSVEIFRRVQAVSFCGCFVLMGIFVIIKCLLKWKVIFLWEMIIVAEDKVCKRVLISPLEVAIVYIDDKDSH